MIALELQIRSLTLPARFRQPTKMRHFLNCALFPTLGYLALCGFVAFAAADSPKVIFDRAVQALTAGNYPAAEQEFQAVLRQEPNNIAAIVNLGILYARTNRTDKAVAEYKKALQLSPNDEPILLNLGLVYLKQEFHSKALPYFARVVALDPKNLQARQLLAVCRIYTGKLAEGIQDLEKLEAANPKNEQLLFLLGFAYLKNDSPDKAKTVFNRMLEVAGPAQAQFLLGRASYEASIFPQAEESFLEVRKLEPDFPGLHVELAKVYISERREEDAIRELKAALKQNPTDEDACYFLGSLLVRDGQDAEGIPYLEKAKELKPDSWAVYFYLGRAKLHSGEKAEAVALLRRAVELNADDASVQYQLGRALRATGQTEAANQVFARASALRVREFDEVTIPGTK